MHSALIGVRVASGTVEVIAMTTTTTTTKKMTAAMGLMLGLAIAACSAEDSSTIGSFSNRNDEATTNATKSPSNGAPAGPNNNAGKPGDTSNTDGAALLTLTGDTEHLTLESPPASPTYRGVYPNPKGVGRMSIYVQISGQVDATCTDAAGSNTTCFDTPFFTKVEHVPGGVDVHVMDMFGVECVRKLFPLPASQDGDGGVCVNSAVNAPNQPACTDQGADTTRDAYCQSINSWLKKHDIKDRIDCDALDGPDYSQMPDAKKKADGSCDDIWGDRYVNIVMRWAKGCECYAERTVRWNNAVRFFLIKYGACAHSPLLLDLDGDGVVSLSNPDHGVDFDLLASGEKVRVSWPDRGDGFLALDRNADGRIDSGSELFGNSGASSSGSNQDGFAALAELDSNGDGIIDPQDPAFAELVVWTDRDRNGVSSASELTSLATLNIRKLETHPVRIAGDDVFDSNANRIPLVASFGRGDGTSARLVDAFLRFK